MRDKNAVQEFLLTWIVYCIRMTEAFALDFAVMWSSHSAMTDIKKKAV